MGNAHPNLMPYETFRTADGELAVAVGSERQWPRLCEAIGLPGLAEDPWYATNGDRVVHRDDLRPILASRFASRTRPPNGSRRSMPRTSRSGRSTT